MNTFLENVRIFDGGYCIQNMYLSGQRSFGFRKFHALFLHFTHPIFGEAVIDTGYSPAFFEATRSFPARFYRWTTPTLRQNRFQTPDFFSRHKIDSRRVETVFLSHLHADHIAGLCYYPQSKIVCRKSSLDYYLNLSQLKQVKHGFLRKLLPNHFEQRFEQIETESFLVGSQPLQEFQVYDYWKDGSLLLVDLPGHALGQTGFLLRTAEHSNVFYVADAYWSIDVLNSNRKLPYISRMIQHDWKAYQETQDKLRNLPEEMKNRIIATHCESAYCLREN
jgi:glyoxylase-like metal-dependent hydrolase (beta-lactamase superfamily II)